MLLQCDEPLFKIKPVHRLGDIAQRGGCGGVKYERRLVRKIGSEWQVVQVIEVRGVGA